MREFFISLFSEYGRVFVFFHILGAIVWIGGTFAARFVAKPILYSFEDQKQRVQKTIEFLRRYFKFISLFAALIVITSVFMNIGMGFKYGNPTHYILIHTKEAIWTLMAVNFIFSYYKIKNAQKQMQEGDFAGAWSYIVMVLDYLLPANMVLGLIALYFGLVLRGM